MSLLNWLVESDVLNAVVEFLSNGLTGFNGWQIFGVAMVFTHLTIAAVTIYLHRNQAHRALDLGPVPSHFFRFWLWMTTGMVTKEWTAIHRKHHAKCEQEGDPHSPVVFGLKKVFFEGSELYRAEAKNLETIQRYGHGTPNDWIERNVYTRFSATGIALMLIVNVALFGVAGMAVWAMQMAWIPINAAGIINGIGHAWGYRNFEAPDASTNVSPWGLLIGGEELHNNHHTYPTSAKFSVKPYEFDLGWVYIRVLQALGQATVKKTPPRAAFGDVRPVADEKTLEALIAYRYEMMAGFAAQIRRTCEDEIAALRTRHADAAVLQLARRWLPREVDRVPAAVKTDLAKALEASPVLQKMVAMREELRQCWLNTQLSREQLTHNLQEWCQRAEASGIAALADFSMKLRAARI